ncbi:MAG: D-alanyl-D-alanine carboxypeptidase/D-alanyl-D-alanine-endopeptidase, partial [Verrucomicrobiota bacterium]
PIEIMKSSRRYLILVLALTHSVLPGFAQPSSVREPAITNKPVESIAQFQARLEKVVTHPRFSAAALGVKVESLDTGKVIFEHDASKLLKPASNGKMYTGALALDRFGPDYKIRTSFYAKSKPDAAGVLSSDLIVFGRGDPSFSHRFNNDNYQKAIEQLVEAIAKAGIKSVQGDLVGDESFFRGTRFGVGWSVDDLQYYYGAEASALTLQENTVDLEFKPAAKIGDPLRILTKPETKYLTFENRTKTVEKGVKGNVEIYRPIDSNVVYVSGTLPLGGSMVADAVAVYNSPLWFISTLREALGKRGITFSGKLKTSNWLDREVSPLNLPQLVEVAFIESRPMSEIVKQMMKPSQNLYAHLLLLQVGEKVRSAENKTMNSDDLGLAELKKFCAEAGIERGAVLMEEGSGLSRGCLLKPAASVQLLKYMRTHRFAETFYNSLPIAGVDGTLKSRFKGTFAEKNLRAKTGTIRYVNSISGYVTSKAGEHLVFAIMLNAYNGSDGRIQIDGIATMLSDLGSLSQ